MARSNLRAALAFLAITDALTVLDLTPWAVTVSQPTDARPEVEVQMANPAGTGAVDRLADYIGLDPAPNDGHDAGIYTRTGHATLHGQRLAVRAFVGVPILEPAGG